MDRGLGMFSYKLCHGTLFTQWGQIIYVNVVLDCTQAAVVSASWIAKFLSFVILLLCAISLTLVILIGSLLNLDRLISDPLSEPLLHAVHGQR